MEKTGISVSVALSGGMELDPAEYDTNEVYRIITSIVVPRPIGWVSTLSEDGVDNLAPYSYFNAVSSYPPVVMFSVGSRNGMGKDTARNALATGEFVVNLVTEPVAEQMDMTSATLPPTDSEFDFAGLTPVDAVTVSPARVEEAAVNLECTLFESLSVYDNTVVLGDVEYMHVDNSLLTDGTLDATKVNAVGRLGGPYYSRIDRMDLEREY